MPPIKQVKLLLFSSTLCGHTRSSIMPTRRLNLRRQILSTAGLPKPTTPLRTEENDKVLSEISTSPLSATKKVPEENTYFSTFQPKKPQKSMPCFLVLFYFQGPIQKTNKQNIILLVFQKTFASLLPIDITGFYPPKIVVFVIGANGAGPPGIKM